MKKLNVKVVDLMCEWHSSIQTHLYITSRYFFAYGLTSLLCIKYTPKPVAKTFQPQLRLSSAPDKEHNCNQKTVHSELKHQFSSKNYKTIFL